MTEIEGGRSPGRDTRPASNVLPFDSRLGLVCLSVVEEEDEQESSSSNFDTVTDFKL